MTKLLFLYMLMSVHLAAAAAVGLRDINPEDEKLLRSKLPKLFNAETPKLDVLDEAIRLLIAQGTYENVFVTTETGGEFSITGKPLRLVEEIRIRGTDEISRSDLADLVEVKPGDRFDRKKAVQAAERIKEFYGEHGFFNAVVEINFNKTESKNIILDISIDERKPCLIQELIFKTSNVDLKTKLEGRFHRLRGRVLTTERVRQLIADLDIYLIDNRYLAAEIVGPEATYNKARTESELTIEIREPFRWEFYFSGIKTATQTDLYRALDLRNRERKNVDPAGEGAERIRRSYLEKGFPNIQIDTKVTNPAGSYLKRVYYTVDEGGKVTITAIDVQGRITRPSKYYQEFILENSSKLVGKRYYNRQHLENGFKNLVTELRNQGHLRARILSSRVEYNERKDAVTIILLLEEGPQTQIRALEFDGNRFFSSFELAQVTGLETNSPLKLGEFESSLTKLKEFYRNQGFLEMRLLNEDQDIIEYNEKGTQARIAFKIFEGPRIRISSIVVEGNSFTKSRVILKEADFKTGELLTPDKIDDALIRLNKLGLFSRVDVRTLEDNTNVAERTLIISVTERDPGVFRFGAGVNNERGLTLRGFTGLNYNNLGGTARALSGRVEVQSNVAQVNYPEHEITAGYLEPFIFNTRTRGRLNLTRSERVFEYERDRALTRIITSNRIDLLAERDLTRYAKLTWKVWSLESRTEWERQGRCLPEDDLSNFVESDGQCSPNTLQIATIGPTLDFDYRDNPFLPTRGSFTRFVVDYSHPSGGSTRGVEFFRAEMNFTHYKPLGSPDVIWANSFRTGYLENLSSDPESGVPTSYAFILGGIYTVRGFDSSSDNERIPKDQYDEHDRRFEIGSGNKKLISTNSRYYLFKSELRFPIYNNHGGVLFYDGGAVYIHGYDFNRPYRDAAGIGYRYNTPVGPLALDIAFKLNPERREEPREEIFRVHLSIGTF